MASVVAMFFSEIDTPLTGASPTCSVRRLDTQVEVSTGAMTEVGDGLYTYPFTATTGLEYSTRCDAGAGAAMPGGRYTWGVIALGNVEDFMLAMAAGNFTEADVSSGVKDFAFLDYDGNAIFTHRITDGTGRTRTAG